MILNGAYLVNDGSVVAFRAALATLEDTYTSLGLSYELTGPWPSYNFVAGTVEASFDERTGS